MRGRVSDDFDRFLAQQRLRLRKRWDVGAARIQRARAGSRQAVSDAWTVRGTITGYSGAMCPNLDGITVRSRRRG